MNSFSQLWNTITQTIVTQRREQPSALTIPIDHVDRQAQLEQPFEPGNDYFQVRINQLFLQTQRQWLTKIDPMVFVVSEFLYNRNRQTMPFVVGPALMKQFSQPIPQGMIFSDTTVAGLHPYRGGALTLSVVLSQMPVGDLAGKFLGVIEKAAKALDFATSLSAYLKVGTVIMEGVDVLFSLNNTLPLVALRKTFDPQAGDTFAPRYFALIDQPNIAPDTLWVRDNQLYQGSRMDSAAPFRDADFVLYSVVRAPDRKRTDIEQLPFYELWERVKTEATTPKSDNWENAKVMMSSLYQAMVTSPDLTEDQAGQLNDDYVARMVRMHETALRNVKHGGPGEVAPPDPLARVRRKALDILKL